ncbi:hypothetical protein LCGC14_0712080 [marine sediment metagenome]|uniref:DUF3168 domain-containing protein n=1 Tax=marine sediment metagenome TaxID=412755 RepID=A0A0F9TMA9_9ZZZZ
MTIQDPIAALRTFLLADSAIAALAGTRIHGNESPVTEAGLQPRYMLVFRFAPGSIPEPDVPLFVPRIDFETYGETPYQAVTLYLALHDALKQLSRDVHNDTLLHGAIRQAGPLSQRDVNTHWPFVWSSWHVWVGEVSTA